VLGPMLFNIFLNDIFGFFTTAKLTNYADDNTLSVMGSSINVVRDVLTAEARVAITWFKDNLMEANPSKFQAMLISPKRGEAVTDFDLEFDGISIQGERSVKLLGVQFDQDLSFDKHIQSICSKAGAQLNVMSRLRHLLDSASKLAIVRSFVTSHFKYCPLIWHFCSSHNKLKIERILRRSLRLAMTDYSSSYEDLLVKAGMCTLEVGRQRTLLVEIFKAHHFQDGPQFISKLFITNRNPYCTRQATNLEIPRGKTTRFGSRSIRSLGPKLWNALPASTKQADSLQLFKTQISGWQGIPCKCRECRYIQA
jgi:hypothetical protein